jgi:hypothetical protein
MYNILYKFVNSNNSNHSDFSWNNIPENENIFTNYNNNAGRYLDQRNNLKQRVPVCATSLFYNALINIFKKFS